MFLAQFLNEKSHDRKVAKKGKQDWKDFQSHKYFVCVKYVLGFRNMKEKLEKTLFLYYEESLVCTCHQVWIQKYFGFIVSDLLNLQSNELWGCPEK